MLLNNRIKVIIIVFFIYSFNISALTKEKYFNNCLTEYQKNDYSKAEKVCRTAFSNLQRPKGVEAQVMTAYSQYYMYMAIIQQSNTLKSLKDINVLKTMKEQVYDAKYAAIRGEINHEKDYYPEAHRKSLGYLIEAERLYKLFQFNEVIKKNPSKKHKEISNKELFSIKYQEIKKENLSKEQQELLLDIINELKESIRFARTVGFDNQIAKAQLEYLQSFEGLKSE